MFVPFSFFPNFCVKDISTTVKDRNFIFGIQVHNDKLYRGIANGHSPICSSLCLSLFLSFQIFASKISPQLLKIETLYLVYRSTTISCIVGLQMGILLFVLLLFVPISFFPNFLSKISPQPLKVETLLCYTGSQPQVVLWD